jgi:peroxiredoxin
MRRFLAFLFLAGFVFAGPPIPRKSPEFTIVEPGNKQSLLSAYRGKVVVLGIFSTTCPHCQHTAQAFSNLQQAFGREGFQAIGITINPESTNDGVVQEFKNKFAPNLPIGHASVDTALSYLGISVMERWVYPQIVLIDRKGMIREQSDSKGTAELQDVLGLRPKIETLLKER